MALRVEWAAGACGPYDADIVHTILQSYDRTSYARLAEVAHGTLSSVPQALAARAGMPCRRLQIASLWCSLLISVAALSLKLWYSIASDARCHRSPPCLAIVIATCGLRQVSRRARIITTVLVCAAVPKPADA